MAKRIAYVQNIVSNASIPAHVNVSSLCSLIKDIFKAQIVMLNLF